MAYIHTPVFYFQVCFVRDCVLFSGVLCVCVCYVCVRAQCVCLCSIFRCVVLCVCEGTVCVSVFYFQVCFVYVCSVYNRRRPGSLFSIIEYE